ncbi:uncharacterized protein LOC135102567 [Scylla paramamosain]|uniref:uncharacterized protein LOC135102567 n=1 Tax=Scylla paramamosain TaxID=85552 RepID=UPI003083641D
MIFDFVASRAGGELRAGEPDSGHSGGGPARRATTEGCRNISWRGCTRPRRRLCWPRWKEPVPRFHVSGLTPGQDYLITVTAVNAKGASDPEEIDAVRLKVAEKRMVEVTPAPVSPLVGVFLGLVGGFVFLLLAGVFLSRGRYHRCRCWGHHQAAEDTTRSSPPPSTTTTTTTTTPTTHARTVSLQGQERRAAPDVLRTINAQLLESDICPEIISARVPPPPYTRTQPAVVRESPATTTAGRSPSPILLPHHESFV